MIDHMPHGNWECERGISYGKTPCFAATVLDGYVELVISTVCNTK